MTKLDHALALAQQGYRVFPLRPNKKTPLLPGNWRTLATTNPEQIKRWWTENPDANIGRPTDGEVVIDVDPRNGGDVSIEALLLCEDFPKTARISTWSGGAHILYRQPPGAALRSSKNRLGDGLDIKANGGYVVAPGSIIDGKPYRYENGRDVAEAPEWLVSECQKTRERTEVAGKRLLEEDEYAVAYAERWLKHDAPDAELGNIDNTAFAVAARFYDFAVSLETCRDLLTQWSYEHANPPMEAHDIDRVARSAETSRDKAIGADHPLAPGFEAYEMGEKPSSKAPDAAPTLLETYADAAAKALSHSGDPLIEGVIDRGTFSAWYGPPKSGKTFIVLSLCLAIATGAPWAGRKTRKGAVIYVAAEGGRGIYKRLRALQMQHPDSQDAPLFVLRLPVDLLHGKRHVELIDQCCKDAAALAGLPVELVVIDTVARALSGGDENSPADMGALVKNLDDLRERTGAHLLAIHHTGKDKTRGMRGHSSLLGAVDTEIQILNRQITSPNQRDLEDDLRLGFALKPVRIGADPNGSPVTSCQVEIDAAVGFVEHDIGLTPMQRRVLESVDQELARTKRNPKEVFGWEFLASFPKLACKPTREAISLHLQVLTDSGWLEKPADNQYLRTCKSLQV